MPKISKLIKHIQNGTLGERIMESLRPRIRRQRIARWNRFSTRRNETVTTIAPGVKMVLNSESILSKAIYAGRFEWQELQFLTRILQPGDTFIDIGSNIGLYSMIAAKRVGKNGSVIAVEPVSKTFHRLERNIQLNKYKNVKAFQLAISSSNGILPMSVSQDGYDAWNSLTKPARGEKFITEEVTTIKFDDFVTQNSLTSRIKMVKVDVEGWEDELFKGAVTTLSAADAPIIQVEFNEPALNAAGSSSEKLMDRILKFGYHLYSYDGTKNILKKFEYSGEALDMNLYAIKDLDSVLLLLLRR
jgi:FkbM family methyltransferase